MCLHTHARAHTHTHTGLHAKRRRSTEKEFRCHGCSCFPRIGTRGAMNPCTRVSVSVCVCVCVCVSHAQGWLKSVATLQAHADYGQPESVHASVQVSKRVHLHVACSEELLGLYSTPYTSMSQSIGTCVCVRVYVCHLTGPERTQHRRGGPPPWLDASIQQPTNTDTERRDPWLTNTDSTSQRCNRHCRHNKQWKRINGSIHAYSGRERGRGCERHAAQWRAAERCDRAAAAGRGRACGCRRERRGDGGCGGPTWLAAHKLSYGTRAHISGTQAQCGC